MPPIGRIANPQLTREQVESLLVLPLMQQNTFLAAGPRIFDSDGSQIRIPKLATTTPPGWHAENEQITEADADFGSIVLLAPSIKSVKVIVKMSNEILRQSVIALESALRDRLTYDVSRVLDRVFFQGDGSADANGNKVPLGMTGWTAANEVQTITMNGGPTGGSFTLTFQNRTTAPIAYNATAADVLAALLALDTVAPGDVTTAGGPLAGVTPAPVTVTFLGNYAATDVRPMTVAATLTGGTNPSVTIAETTKGKDGAQVIDLAGTTPTIDTLHDMVGLALAGYSTPNRWFVTPRVLTFVRKLKDLYGRYLLEPDPNVANQWVLLGIPVSVSNHLAPDGATTGQSTIALCDTNQIAIGRDLEPNVRILDQTFGDRDQTAIRVVTRYDIAPLNGRATVLAKNAAVSGGPWAGTEGGPMQAGRDEPAASAAPDDGDDGDEEDRPARRVIRPKR